MAAGAFLSPRVVTVLIVWSTQAQVDTHLWEMARDGNLSQTS